ncbi:hypothetical protein FA09DRAFT_53827 [Tilletiopsis washingtonensis]|uniref:Uncharacterized protein n=1 Tax=Tilletiopsis washingtonensis TaxID=58919 RepID=A0A316Z753_9BASI|nr:hypothetical protein FA09DRAFT_53827 [Tilletiopsis washingtonensis]PWN97429.1 hypothetical protein FA09DRAFT_53827 [Tilletiopsis washingtonensis]
MVSRANLLAGLRTGGPRSSSPGVDSGSFPSSGYQTPASPTMHGGKPASPNALKANAAVFTPTSRFGTPPMGGGELQQAQQQSPSPHQRFSPTREQQMQQEQQAALEAQLSAMRIQQLVASQNQGLAAMYGATQGQPQQQQQLHYEQLLRQQQQQTDARRTQQQLEAIRAQSIAAQQLQQQTQVATQQRMLLAQIQAEYERQAQVAARTEQYGAQTNSAAEQRQAAQASIQASLRQRQSQQQQQAAYAQLVEQQQAQQAHDEQAQLMQRLQYIQMQVAQQQQLQQQAVAMAAMQQQQQQHMYSLEQQLGRVGTPPNAKAQQQRERTVSHADTAASWRTRAPAASTGSATSTPSIIVDDSASEKSFASESGTPDTSEENVQIGADRFNSVSARKTAAANAAAVMTARYGAVSDGTASKPSAAPIAAPASRITALAQPPRGRSATEGKITAPTTNGTVAPGVGLGLPNQPMRQPKGPPTEFRDVNFASRISARTRKEAMSRLCASPRASTFSAARSFTMPVQAA